MLLNLKEEPAEAELQDVQQIYNTVISIESPTDPTVESPPDRVVIKVEPEEPEKEKQSKPPGTGPPPVQTRTIKKCPICLKVPYLNL